MDSELVSYSVEDDTNARAIKFVVLIESNMCTVLPRTGPLSKLPGLAL